MQGEHHSDVYLSNGGHPFWGNTDHVMPRSSRLIVSMRQRKSTHCFRSSLFCVLVSHNLAATGAVTVKLLISSISQMSNIYIVLNNRSEFLWGYYKAHQWWGSNLDLLQQSAKLKPLGLRTCESSGVIICSHAIIASVVLRDSEMQKWLLHVREIKTSFLVSEIWSRLFQISRVTVHFDHIYTLNVEPPGRSMLHYNTFLRTRLVNKAAMH